MKGVVVNDFSKGDYSLKLNMGVNVTLEGICPLFVLRFCKLQ
jgi:hypothetical protein